MSEGALLREIAHVRSGDKGDCSNVCVFARDPAHYGALVRELTPERLHAEFGGLFRGRIRRHELPRLHGLNFVLEDAIEGGVNQSLNLDGHGKSWSGLFLGLRIGAGPGEGAGVRPGAGRPDK